MRRWARYWWRRLTGKCIVCGRLRQTHRTGPWMLPLTHACGWCNKRIQHGFNYGMGREEFLRAAR